MSLLDNVSIVVTPNGYKAGELYAVIPVPTEGAEEITNGDFSSSTGWSFTNSGGSYGWIIDAGRAICDASATTPNRNLNSTFSLVNGKSYRLIIDILQSADNMKIVVGGTTLSETLPTGTNLNYEYFIPEAVHSGGGFTIYGGSSDLQEIDNVSVKEYTSADMDVTRATAATRVDEDGLIADVLSNVPRIDYTGGGCPHILAEPERTNLVTYSEPTSSQGSDSNISYESFNWGVIGFTEATVFDGSLNPFSYMGTSTASTVWTLSCFVKMDDLSEPMVGLGGSNDFRTVIGNTQDGTNVISKIDFGNNVWKISATNTTSAANLNNNGLRVLSNSGKSFRATGFQLEQGSYATSYIPNFGTSSGVTRNQDIFTRDGIGSLINSTEGVLFLEIAALVEVDSARRHITLNDGGASNKVVIRYESTGVITARYDIGGSAQASIAFATTITNSHKIAFKYKENDFALWVDGTEIGTETSGSVLSADTINKISFDSGNGTFPFYGKVKQLQVYTSALTDAQLTSLTS